MSQLRRLILWPALTGLMIAILILYLFPQITQPESDTNLADNQSSPAPEDIYSTDRPTLSGPVSYSDAVKKAAPAVVSVYTSRTVNRKLPVFCRDPFWRRFTLCNPSQSTQTGLGSGVVIGEQGYVLTNNHVIANADEIMIQLADGREIFAQVVGTDADTDLAVLQIDLDDLPVISIASSENLEVGDVVLAIGNPFGVGQTVTMGIVSATGRSQLQLTRYDDFIQTDAAINPGNSGGALINAYGDLIGINTAIFSKSGGSEGIGFAIPSQLANRIMQEIIQYGSVERGWIGVQVLELNQALAEAFNLEQRRGSVISDLVAGGPAQAGGLKIGDIIVQIDQMPVQNGRQAMTKITDAKPGQVVTIHVIREGVEQQLNVEIGKQPQTYAEG